MTAEQPRSLVWGPFSRLCAIVAGATLVLDQAHKAYMLYVLRIADPGRGRIYVTPFLDWAFVLNEGISYGIAIGNRWLLTLFAIATSIALWVWVAYAGTGRLMATGLGLIIGGAIGNAIDRVLYGGVVDYFALHAFGYSWYVFNIADAAIVAGVLALLYESLLGKS